MSKYKEYLNSEEWKHVRAQIRERAQGKCELCGAVMRDVHHVTYAKRWSGEHPDNLLATCRQCHHKLHGIRDVKEITNFTLEKFQGSRGQSIQVAVDERGWVYATPEKWAEAIGLPDSRKVLFFSGLPWYAEVLEGEHAGGQWRAIIQGKEVYRWHVVEEGIDIFYNENIKYRNMSSPPLSERVSFDFFHRIRLLKHWGRNLQEEAIAKSIRRMAAPVKDDVSALADAISRSIGPHLGDHKRHLEDHEGRINKLEEESKTKKDPEEFITVREACLELCTDPEQLVSGKRNLQNMTGEFLSKRGADKGLPRACRPSGSSVITQVNTWRRSELYEAIEEALKLRDLPLFQSMDRGGSETRRS
ncbi:MAG: hypothetical protein CVU69_10465 [Deltaproteobacteria bacterium HGW-Deltaproteobacteria-4]|nr:MAG: hypothetical protein CVU69_10465 [Deltaproteobacteria bacterium HGW-Deltaproteobacteria-4]